jgi:hypothetical protein
MKKRPKRKHAEKKQEKKLTGNREFKEPDGYQTGGLSIKRSQKGGGIQDNDKGRT